MLSVLTPVVQNKQASPSNSSNYMPIAIASFRLKVMETILLQRIEKYVETAANQFGFKKTLSTDLSTLLLKETIRNYIGLGSNVFVCFMDASETCDRVNY